MFVYVAADNIYVLSQYSKVFTLFVFLQYIKCIKKCIVKSCDSTDKSSDKNLSFFLFLLDMTKTGLKLSEEVMTGSQRKTVKYVQHIFHLT